MNPNLTSVLKKTAHSIRAAAAASTPAIPELQTCGPAQSDSAATSKCGVVVQVDHLMATIVKHK